jgi:ribose transport system substrate-binding protein
VEEEIKEAVEDAEAVAEEPAAEGDYTYDTYPWTDFQQMDAGEYFKGILFKADYADRSGIEKGLPTESKSGLKVRMALNSLSNAFFVTLRDSVAERCEKYGYTFEAVPYDGESTKMVSALEDFVTQQCDAIVLDATDKYTAALTIDQTVAPAGIPTIVIGQPSDPACGIVTSIYPSFYQVGFHIAYNATYEYFSDPEDKIVMGTIMGIPMWHTWSNSYIAGMYMARMEIMGTPVTQVEAMEKCYEYYQTLFDTGSVEIPEANISCPVIIPEGGFTEEGGMSAAEAILTAAPETNVITAVNDFMTHGAITAIENSGKKPGEDVILFCSCDGSQEGVEDVKAGKLYATNQAGPSIQAYAAVDLLHAIFEEGYDANNLEQQTVLPLMQISMDTIENYDNPGETYAKQPMDYEVKFRTIDEAFQEDIIGGKGYDVEVFEW